MSQVDEKLEPILNEVLRRNAGEGEFHQPVREVLESLGRVVAKPAMPRTLIERICEPEPRTNFACPGSTTRTRCRSTGLSGAVQFRARAL